MTGCLSEWDFLSIPMDGAWLVRNVSGGGLMIVSEEKSDCQPGFVRWWAERWLGGDQRRWEEMEWDGRREHAMATINRTWAGIPFSLGDKEKNCIQSIKYDVCIFLLLLWIHRYQDHSVVRFVPVCVAFEKNRNRLELGGDLADRKGKITYWVQPL